MAEEKIYVGNGKEKTFDDGGSTIRVSICLSDLPKEFITEAKNKKKYINLIVGKLKEENKYGNTHSVRIDTWKPEPKTAAPAPSPQDEEDDLPF